MLKQVQHDFLRHSELDSESDVGFVDAETSLSWRQARAQHDGRWNIEECSRLSCRATHPNSLKTTPAPRYAPPFAEGKGWEWVVGRVTLHS